MSSNIVTAISLVLNLSLSLSQLFKMDIMYIFDFNGEDQAKIPAMTVDDLNTILLKDMKLGKAADIYKLTVEHVRFAGIEAKTCILNLLNDIIRNIHYLNFIICTDYLKCSLEP